MYGLDDHSAWAEPLRNRDMAIRIQVEPMDIGKHLEIGCVRDVSLPSSDRNQGNVRVLAPIIFHQLLLAARPP